MNDRLYRSRDDRVLAGVAGGLAERLDLDPSLVRIVWAILVVLSGGLFLLLYVIMAIVVPEAPYGADRWAGWTPASAPPAPGAVPGWGEPQTGQAFAAAEPPTGSSPAAEPGSEPQPSGATPDVAAPGAPPPGAAFAAPAQPSTPPPAVTPPPGWSSSWDTRRSRRRGGGAVIGGIVLVLIGSYFLLRTVAPEIAIGPFWPVIVIIVGVALVLGSFRTSR